MLPLILIVTLSPAVILKDKVLDDTVCPEPLVAEQVMLCNPCASVLMVSIPFADVPIMLDPSMNT